MAATFGLRNIGQPTPIIFQRVDKAISILSNVAIVILYGIGWTDKDHVLIMLILKVGVSSVMSAVGALLGVNGATIITPPTDAPAK